MVLQSLIRNCVNDFWGKLEIGGCVAKDTCISFGNIKTRLGVTVSGKIENGRAVGSICAERDAVFEFQAKEVRMKKDETMEYDFYI
jgi:hypothetical protein